MRMSRPGASVLQIKAKMTCFAVIEVGPREARFRLTFHANEPTRDLSLQNKPNIDVLRRNRAPEFLNFQPALAGGPPLRMKMGDPRGAVGGPSPVRAATRYSKMSKNGKACSPNTLWRGRSAFVLHPEKYFRGKYLWIESATPFGAARPFRGFDKYTGGKTADATVMPRGRGRVALVNPPAARPPALRYAAGERTAGAFGPQQRLYLAPEPQGHGAPRGMGADSAATGKVCIAGGRGA